MIGTLTTASRAQLLTALRHTGRRTLASVSAAASPSSSKKGAAADDRPTSWQLPLPPGIEPAYDEALKYIAGHQAQLKRHIASLQDDVEVTVPGTPERVNAEALLRSYVIASQIDDPAVRWTFENDPEAPLSNPVFAHLREKTWRKADVPRLIERVRLMSVVPDALPELVPSADVRVYFGQGTGIHDHGGEGGVVQAGCFVDPRKTLKQPAVLAQTFHTEQRLYTMALVDLDAPDVKEDRLATYAHWLVHNVPLSVSEAVVDVKEEQVALPYIAPHPQRGTKYHRYCLVLMEQTSNATVQVDAAAAHADALASKAKREHFSLADLIAKHNLRPAGVHFWRAIWSDDARQTISSVYADVLKQPEPHYGHLPRRDRW